MPEKLLRTGSLDPVALRRAEPVLRAVAYRAVRRSELVDDLLQETYLAAWQGRASFEGRSTLRTWMVGILHRKIADHFRRSRREVLTDRPPEPERATRPTPEQRLDATRARELMERHLGDLPALEKGAFILCDVERSDRAEAARALGVTRGHLRVLLHRGRQRMRAVVAEADLAPAA